jgi:hypothetical protein
MVRFGKLEIVPIREGWPREDTEFTPWLATDENLSSLGEEIGFGLELVEMESGVGQYRVDILAKRVGTDETVVIENQFGKTDHSHLGQLLTYAAGVGAEGTGAKTIVWIAENFTEPHRAALDWLNQCTEPGIRFFGVELQLWRIGESALAPKFSVVSRPNDWQKQLTQETAVTSGVYQLYKEFWTAFIEYCGDQTSLLMTSAPAQHWLPTSIGRRGFSINLTASKRDKKLECQLWIEARQAKSAFATLLSHREAIVSALGSHVEFDEMPTKQACKIFEKTTGDVNNRENWPIIHQWLKERGEAYVAVFTPLVKQLKLD